MRNQQTGVSLIEVLIAVAVLAAGIVTLVKFQGDLLRDRSAVSQQAEALQIARAKLDDLRHYTVLETTPGQKAYADIASGSDTVTEENVVYTRTWTVSEVTSPPHKVVSVNVTWTDQLNKSHTVTLDSIIGKVNPTMSGSIMQGL